MFPDVKFTFDAYPWEEMTVKRQAELAAGSSKYAIMEVDYCGEVQQFSAAGFLIPIDTWLLDDKEYMKDVTSDIHRNVLGAYIYDPETKERGAPEGTAEIGKGKAHLWCMPHDSNVIEFFYRTDLVESVNSKWTEDYMTSTGLTYAEVLEAAKKLHKPPDLQAIGITGNWGWVFHGCYETVLWSMGGEIYDPKTYEPEGVLNSDIGVRALETLKKLYDYGPKEQINWGEYDTSQQMGYLGRLAMCPVEYGTSAFTRTAEAGVTPFGDKVRTGLVPKDEVTGHEVRPNMGGWGLGIISFEKDKDVNRAAYEYLRFVVSRQNGRNYVQNTGQPTRSSVLLDSENLKIMPYYKGHDANLKRCRWRPPIAEYWELDSIGGKALADYLAGKIPTAKAALDKAAKDIRALFVKTGRLK